MNAKIIQLNAFYIALIGYKVIENETEYVILGRYTNTENQTVNLSITFITGI